MSKPVMISKKEFKEFEYCVHYWLQRLGMTEWEVHVHHEQGASGELASVSYASEDKYATFYLAEYTEDGGRRPYTMEFLALHEVLHLLIADIVWTAARSRTDDSVIVAHEHEFINRMIRVLL